MSDRTAAWLWDAAAAAQAVMDFVEDLDESAYLASALHRAAVERQLGILGEALVRIRRDDPELAARIPDLPQVIGMRNILAHEYGSVDNILVHEVATTRIPPLLKVLNSLMT